MIDACDINNMSPETKIAYQWLVIGDQCVVDLWRVRALELTKAMDLGAAQNALAGWLESDIRDLRPIDTDGFMGFYDHLILQALAQVDFQQIASMILQEVIYEERL